MIAPFHDRLIAMTSVDERPLGISTDGEERNARDRGALGTEGVFEESSRELGAT